MTNSMQGCSYSVLMSALPNIIKQRIPILLRGRHGIGKSEIVYQLAPHIPKILGKTNKIVKVGTGKGDLKILERRASQMPDAGDLTGLPFKHENFTKFLPMEFMHLACTEGCIIFFDEIDRAKKDVGQALMELTDSRKLNGEHLHPDTVIFAACNGMEEDYGYQVQEFDPACLSRWAVFDFEPTVNDWLDYAKDKVNNIIWDFIHNNRQHLEHNGKEFEANKVYPTRRSWFRLNKCLSETNWLEQPTLEVDGDLKPRMDLFFLTQSFVGNEAAIAFRDFVQNYKHLLTIEDIVNDGQIEKAKRLSINEHMALIESFADSDLLKSDLSDTQIENLCKFLFVIEPELVMNLWKIATKNNKKNGIKLHQKVINGKSVSSYLAALNGGDL